MASRSPLALIPEMRELYKQFCAEMDKAGISWILTCTRRTQADQDELYARGRSKPGQIVNRVTAEDVNKSQAGIGCMLRDLMYQHGVSPFNPAQKQAKTLKDTL